MTWLMTLWARIQGWALTGLALVAAAAGVFLAGRREGRAAAKTDALQDTIDKVRERDEAVDEVSALPVDNLRDRAKRRMREPGDR